MNDVRREGRGEERGGEMEEPGGGGRERPRCLIQSECEEVDLMFFYLSADGRW